MGNAALADSNASGKLQDCRIIHVEYLRLPWLLSTSAKIRM